MANYILNRRRLHINFAINFAAQADCRLQTVDDGFNSLECADQSALWVGCDLSQYSSAGYSSRAARALLFERHSELT
ncbi:MAG: hypothetical protein ACR2HX_09700 [Pyrinomonadaceae bacterium]